MKLLMNPQVSLTAVLIAVTLQGCRDQKTKINQILVHEKTENDRKGRPGDGVGRDENRKLTSVLMAATPSTKSLQQSAREPISLREPVSYGLSEAGVSEPGAGSDGESTDEGDKEPNGRSKRRTSPIEVLPGKDGETPLVFDLRHLDQIRTATGLGYKPIAFDLKATGTKQNIEWIGPENGWLTLDLNGNGLIDNGRELFGSATVLEGYGPLTVLATHGFEALGQHDKNKDGVIDPLDAVFEKLLIWQDQNLNGTSDPGELRSLTHHGIIAISLDYQDIDRLAGTLPQSEAYLGQKAYYAVQVSGSVELQWVYDIYFPEAPPSLAGR